MQIVFLVSYMSVYGSFYDVQNFILREVLVSWNFVPWSHVLCHHNKVPGAVVFWTDLQDEVPRRGLSPNPSLTLILLQQEWVWSSLRSGRGTGLC